MPVPDRMEKAAQQVVPSEYGLEGRRGLHPDRLLQVLLQTGLPVETLLLVIGVEVADDVPADRQIGRADRLIGQQSENETAPRGEGLVGTSVVVPVAFRLGEQAARCPSVEPLFGQGVLNMQIPPLRHPVGVICSGLRRCHGVLPVGAPLQPFVIGDVPGQSGGEQPGDKRNVQFPGAAVAVISRGGFRGVGTPERCRLLREDEGRGKRSEYLFQRLRVDSGGQQRADLHPVALGPLLRVGIG